MTEDQAWINAAILDGIEDGFVVFDQAWRIRLLNQKAIEALNWPLEIAGLIGRVAWEAIPELNASTLGAQLKAVAESRAAIKMEELSSAHGRWQSLRILPGPHGVSLFIHDLTTRKRAEQQLALSDRMTALGTLANGIAHEINNPLAAVMANLSFLAEDLRSAGMAAEATRSFEELIEEARTGADRIRRIVQGLRSFGRADSGAPEEVEVRAAIESALPIVLNEIRHRAQLIREFEPTPKVLAGESRLRQLLVNLLINAAHAIEEGHADRNEIRIRTRTDEAGWAQIEISDTGSGIPEEIQSRIFDPFFTTRPVGSGTGLGLSITHGIVTALGGTINLESSSPKGSCFRVRLPPFSGRLPATLDAAGPGERGRVLVIDDDAHSRRAIAGTLKREHQVTVHAEARAALAEIEAGERFDAILCDVMMPEMTGLELHQRLTEVAPDQAARIIFVTGGAFTEATQTSLDRLPNTVIEKPFELTVVRELVRSMLRVRPSRP